MKALRFILLSTLCALYLCVSAQPSANYQIIPMPQHIDLSATGKSFLLKSEKQIHTSIVPDRNSPEGYSLVVDAKGVHITGHSQAGVFYGLQTLRQAMPQGYPVRLPYVHIQDAPRFGYRGVMIDVSRHFYPLDYLKKQIVAMSRYKLNRLHLHLTDAAGWRLQINRYPILTEVAAWREGKTYMEWRDRGAKYLHEGASEASGGYYTQKEMRELVDFAAQHHITIIPEIEMPGHSEEVMATFPELSCAGEPYKQGEFCVGNEQVYEWVENVLSEVVQIFPSEYIHIGGDEANKEHWKTCPKCQALMQREGLKDVDELQSYFIKRVEKIVNKLGRQLLGWDEILEGGLSPNATVMSWRGEQGGITTVKAGHHAIMTPGEYLYLDKYQDAPHTQPDAIGGYLPLRVLYGYEPIPDSLSVAEAKLIDGVQGNLWAEYIPTQEHNEMMIWPRAMGLAEIGWVQQGQKNYPAFRERVLRELPVMRQLGYHVFDLEHEVGNRTEYDHPVTHLALNKKVTYNIPYGSQYPANGQATLTDGLQGGWTYFDKRWQGFIANGRLDVTIDLEQVQDIHSIQATFMQTEGAWVFYPTSVDILVSEDGVNFTSIYKGGVPVNRTEAFGFNTFGWQGNQRARYVRYKADCSEDGCWLFTDEVIVK